MAYIPKTQAQERQLASMGSTLLTSGNPTQGVTADPGQAGTQNTAGGSAMALKQGSGGVGNQFTNFGDLLDANAAGTANQANLLSQTLGITGAEQALNEAQNKAGSAAQGGVSSYDDDFLNQYINSPFEVDRDKYGNLASILGGSGYKGPNEAGGFYGDAQEKLLRAQENASVLGDVSGLQALLSKNPTYGTTAGGIGLDANLLGGSETAKGIFKQAQDRAGGLTGQFETSQKNSAAAIQAAKDQQEKLRQTAAGKISGAQGNIRTQAEQSIANKLATDQQKFASAQQAAKTGDFAALRAILGDDSVSGLEDVYKTLNEGTNEDLSGYVRGPESLTTGYSSGDVLTPEQIAYYKEYGNILQKPDDFIQAAKTPGGMSLDRMNALDKLKATYGNQENYRQEIARAQAAEQARLAAEEAARKEAERIANLPKPVVPGTGGSGGQPVGPRPPDKGSVIPTVPGGPTTPPSPTQPTTPEYPTSPDELPGLPPGPPTDDGNKYWGGPDGLGEWERSDDADRDNSQLPPGGYWDNEGYGYDANGVPVTGPQGQDYTDSGSGHNKFVDWVVDNYPDQGWVQNAIGTLVDKATGIPVAGTIINWLVNGWKNEDPTNVTGRDAINGADKQSDDALRERLAEEALQREADRNNNDPWSDPNYDPYDDLVRSIENEPIEPINQEPIPDIEPLPDMNWDTPQDNYDNYDQGYDNYDQGYDWGDYGDYDQGYDDWGGWDDYGWDSGYGWFQS